MKGGLVSSLLKLALLLEATCFCIVVVDDEGSHPQSQDVTTHLGDEEEPSFLDTLIRPGTDMIASFSLAMLKDLHQHSLQCRMNLSSVDMKYSVKMNKLVKYHQSLEKVVFNPTFEDMAGEDRAEVEANFRSSLKHFEKERNKELLKVQANCDSSQQEWVATKFMSAVNYAKKILDSDRQQYRELIVEMQSYRAKMQRHLATCRHGDQSFGQLYCYVEELDTLLQLIDNFLEIMDNIVVLYFGDDEDLTEERQGSGVGEGSGDPDDATVPPSPTVPVTSKITHIKLPPGFFGVGPVIIDPHASKATPTTTQTTPTPEATPIKETRALVTPSPTEPSPVPSSTSPAANSGAMEEPGSQQSTPTSSNEVSITRSRPQPHNSDSNSEIPAETSAAPHSEAVPPWLDRAFEEILPGTGDEQEEETGGEEPSRRAPSGSKTSKRRPSEMPLPPRPDTKLPHPPSVDIEVQGSYDGNQVDFSLEVGGQGDGEGDHTPERSGHRPGRPDHTHNRPDHAHGRPVVGSVILDPPKPPDPQQPESEDSWTYTYSILTYFFLTLGVIIIAFSVIIVAMVSVNRLRRRRRGQKVNPPVLSEKEMLEMMKATGYVNPTYKFYAQS